MSRVRITHDPWDPIMRQTPGDRGQWDEYQFVSEDTSEDFDAWVVCERLSGAEVGKCPPERTVFITWEPQSFRRYDKRFLAQFAVVVSPHRDLPHPRVIHMQPALPWTVGVLDEDTQHRRFTLDFDGLTVMAPPPKPKLLSVICSKKAMTEGHRKRLELIERLQGEFGDQMEVFGRGFNPITNKWPAIADYRYHLTLENCELPDYWTEKLSDAFLGFSYPIYSGCPNIADYFSTSALTPFERADMDAAVRTIEKVLSDDPYAAALPAIVEARRRVLWEHNLFAVLVGVLRTLPKGSSRTVRIAPETHFTDPLRRKIKRTLKAVFNR